MTPEQHMEHAARVDMQRAGVTEMIPVVFFRSEEHDGVIYMKGIRYILPDTVLKTMKRLSWYRDED